MKTTTVLGALMFLSIGIRLSLLDISNKISGKFVQSQLKGNDSLKPSEEDLKKSSEYAILAKYLDKAFVVIFILWLILTIFNGELHGDPEEGWDHGR